MQPKWMGASKIDLAESIQFRKYLLGSYYVPCRKLEAGRTNIKVLRERSSCPQEQYKGT